MEASEFISLFGSRITDFMIRYGVREADRKEVYALFREARDLVAPGCGAWDGDRAAILVMKAIADASMAANEAEEARG